MAKKSTGEPAQENKNQAVVIPDDAQQAKVIWDDSQMRTSYANVCNIMGTREEITLMFGSNQTWQIGQDQMRVVLSDRIVINPYMAKRLMGMLAKGLEEYESRFGTLSI